MRLDAGEAFGFARRSETPVAQGGYLPEQIEDLLRDLPDPIDTERDAAACFERGLSVGSLMDRMGGSP